MSKLWAIVGLVVALLYLNNLRFINNGWRRWFATIHLRKRYIQLAYGPDFIWWAQWHQGDGEWACGVAWFTICARNRKAQP